MISKKILLLYFLLVSFVSLAQGWEPNPNVDPGFGGGSGDPATEPVSLPVNSIELPLLITGVIIGIVFIRKKRKVVTN